MARFKVVQVVEPLFERPAWLTAWIAEQLENADIDFSEISCWNKEDLARHAGDADLVWTTGSRPLLEGENLTPLTKCGAILRSGSGTDEVDVKLATEMGIIVANTPHAVAEPVADHAISLLFSLVRHVTRHDRLIRAGHWDPRLAMPGRTYRGATLGLVGFGRIPQHMVRKLSGFEMNIVAYDPYVAVEVIASQGAKSAALDELLQTADYVSLHCPLTEETHHLMGERELRLMQSQALLVNTARGEVVDEPALIRALREGWIAGAALDVLEQEPPEPDNPLLSMDNVIITAHLGGYSNKGPQEVYEASVEAIIDLAEGRWPHSVVNPKVEPRWGQLSPAAPG